MPGSLEYSIWILSALLEAGVLVCAFLTRSFNRYFTINLYMAASLAVNVLRYLILVRYGFGSDQYFYCYYYSDAVLTICLYFALMGLYSHVFDEMKAEKYVRLGATLLLAGTAMFSYSVVQQSSYRLLTHFVVEMSQNLYFVGLVLTYLLWASILKLRETRTRLIHLVLSLGIYFSAFAANYALRNLYPQLHLIWGYLPPLLGCLLPLSWAYTFWRLPEEARLAPSRLAVIPR